MDKELMDVLWLLARWRWEESCIGPGSVTPGTVNAVDDLLDKHGLLFTKTAMTPPPFSRTDPHGKEIK